MSIRVYTNVGSPMQSYKPVLTEGALVVSGKGLQNHFTPFFSFFRLHNFVLCYFDFGKYVAVGSEAELIFLRLNN